MSGVVESALRRLGRVFRRRQVTSATSAAAASDGNAAPVEPPAEHPSAQRAENLVAAPRKPPVVIWIELPEDLQNLDVLPDSFPIERCETCGYAFIALTRVGFRPESFEADLQALGATEEDMDVILSGRAHIDSLLLECCSGHFQRIETPRKLSWGGLFPFLGAGLLAYALLAMKGKDKR